jgi:hypothetical protein
MLSIPITNKITGNDICIVLHAQLPNNPRYTQRYLNIDTTLK